MSSLVEAAGLRIAFGSRPVLEGVDLSLDAGAELALVGRSGSGKSTLLLLLAGLLRPDGGAVRWPGLSEDPQDRRAQLGLVFQAPSLLSELTAEQNVALPLRLRGTSREAAYEAAGRALDQLGLAAAATALPDELSGGQQQRVALARALAGDPLVLLADEPTGALDSETAREVVRVLRSAVTARGGALVIATHDERLAGDLADRWELADGRLVGPAARSTGVGVGA